MATKKAEAKEEKTEKDTSRKKVATGNTEKIVKKRSSSVTNKENNSKRTNTTKKSSTKKQEDDKKATNGNEKPVSNTKAKKNVKNEKIDIDSKDKKDEKVTEQIKDKKSKIKHKENLKVDIEKVQTVIEKEAKSKQIPKEELNKINKRVFQNVFLAIIVMIYLNFIILGFINIENDVFLVDLKVFGMSILALAIGIFEYAYKKDSGIHAIYGIEVLVLALITIGFIYLNIMHKNKFIPIVMLIAYVFAIYYIAKSIIIYKKLKKEYFMNNIKEIIKRKED
ncbi:MAG: hypothetical protein ACI4UU_02740 [Clostridia bacterium]